MLDRLAGEHGCHVRTSLGGATEIVRVAARKRFVDALESSAGVLPENPEELLPVVRRYRYDPSDTGAAALCEVEDYVLCHAAGHRVRAFAEVLTVLGLLHQTVETAGASG